MGFPIRVKQSGRSALDDKLRPAESNDRRIAVEAVGKKSGNQRRGVERGNRRDGG